MTNRECLKELWKAAKGTRWKTLQLCVVGTLAASISLAFVWSCKLLVDIATGHSSVPLMMGVALLIGCLVFQRVFWTTQSRLATLNSVRIQNDMRRRIFTHLMQCIWVGKEKFHSGDILNRMEEDARVVSSAISNSVASVVIAGFQFLAAFIFLCKMDTRLALILVIIMPIALVVSKIYTYKMRRMTKDIRSTDSRVQEHLQENLQHRILLRTLEQTESAVEEVTALQSSLYQQVKRRTRFSLFTRTVIIVGFNIGYATVFLWCIWGLRDGSVTYGMMTAFLQLVAMIQRPILNLSQELPTFIHAMTSVERVHELMEMPLEETSSPIRLDGKVGLKLQNVDFTYADGTEKVLEDFTHNFQPGTITAIVGETGIGKSTLIRLILALFKPQSGKILVYNDLKEVECCPDTRCNMVYVPQGNTLLSGTIKENLLLGKKDATDEEIKLALHIAVADFVFDLPEGLNTLCGERGTGLSEGQAQRIAIARGLLRPGNILILDEPTSALDLETENALVQRLNENINNKTVIIVTHRESILKLCQEVIKMEKPQ